MHVFLTPEARALEATLLPAVAEVNAVALAGLTPTEIDILRKALTQVGRNLAIDADEITSADSAA